MIVPEIRRYFLNDCIDSKKDYFFGDDKNSGGQGLFCRRICMVQVPRRNKIFNSKKI